MDPNNEINIEQTRNKVKKLIWYNNVHISYLAACKFTFVTQIIECHKSVLIEEKKIWNIDEVLVKFDIPSRNILFCLKW